MDFKALTEDQRKEMAELMFSPLQSADDIKDWARMFLDLELPLEITDPGSTSSPLDAIWQIYETAKNNSGDITPGYILMSCREGMKCQVRGTITLLDTGFKNIEEVKKGDVVWTGFSWQKVTRTFDEGLKSGLKVIVDGGFSAIGTPIHKYWVLRDGKEQWVASKDLNPETDLICINTNTGFKNSTIRNKEKYEIGYFLGLLIGDGGLTQMDKLNRVSLTTTDESTAEFFSYFAEKYLPKVNIYHHKYEYRITSKLVAYQLHDWGLRAKYSWEKTIPSYAYSDIDAMKGFIAGVFDTDGCWDKKGDSFFEMTAGPLLDQMQIALAALGIESRVRHNSKLYGLQKHLVSRLTIGQTESAKFEKLGISFKAKKAQSYKKNKIPNCKDSLPIIQAKDLLELCSRYGHAKIKNRKIKKERTDQANYYKGVSSSKLNRLCQWMNENYESGYVSEKDIEIVRRYEKILLNKWKKFTVEDVGEQYFYDLTVENEHSYWSNGLISHNTVSVAILELLIMLHFSRTVAHGAATEEQSAVAIGYINDFVTNIGPLLEISGWENMTQNKRTIRYRTPEGKTPFIKILICTAKGMNSLHANFLFLDELDLADAKAIKQGKNITGFSRGFYGIKVYLSTRKYAFGNMQDALDKSEEMNYKVLSWNILDVTEACPTSRHKPELPKQDMFVAKNLPLMKLTGDEYNSLPDLEKPKYDMIPNAHGGCVSCKLLPVCRTRLSQKPQTATGGFYKPIVSVIQKFAENDVEIAEAELMCWKPGSEGLVYPRFSDKVDTGNVISLKKAYETLIGTTAPSNITVQSIYAILKSLDIPVYCGVDWGHTHDAVILAMAHIPNGEVWVIDCFASPKLEIQDLVPVALNFKEKYNVRKWYCDTSAPAYIKAFVRNGMPCPKFIKDVQGGIGSVRSKIMTAMGQRLLKVLETDTTKKVRTAVMKHRFVLDGQGQVTMTPDDDAGIADICDSLRYLGQNMFPISGPQRPNITAMDPNIAANMPVEQQPTTEQHEMMKKELAKAIGGPVSTGGTGRRGGFTWNM